MIRRKRSSINCGSGFSPIEIGTCCEVISMMHVMALWHEDHHVDCSILIIDYR